MKDKWIYISIIATGLVCMGIGAGVQYTFDSITINSQRETIELYKAELMEWVNLLIGSRDTDIEDVISERFNITKYYFHGGYFMLIDTDNDGVSDWEEIFVNHTNPFFRWIDGYYTNEVVR